MAGKSLKELKELITKDIEYQAYSIESHLGGFISN